MHTNVRPFTLIAGAIILAWTGAFHLLGAQEPSAARAESRVEKPPSEEGLYMTFETDFGNIQCKLFEKETPHTVHMIVGLAMGKISYVDPKTKQTVVDKRFFDGLTFHRVIPHYTIQGGDPLGTGYGEPQGPGFPFADEFVPSLKYDVPGRLAMANAGRRGTNGSQFFITEVPATYLNGRNTIFGQCGNLDVIKAIARVPAKNERPLKPVVINRVVIERIGPVPAGAPEAEAPLNN